VVQHGEVRRRRSREALPAQRLGDPALVDRDSLAYFTQPRRAGDGQWELGATGHGPAGLALANRICDQTCAWAQDRADQPIITPYRTGTPDEQLAGTHIIGKRDSRLVISYPADGALE